jgi:hypothetical protein
LQFDTKIEHFHHFNLILLFIMSVILLFFHFISNHLKWYHLFVLSLTIQLDQLKSIRLSESHDSAPQQVRFDQWHFP